MMPRARLFALCLALICTAALAPAKEKKPKAGPVTGTWQCMSHGSSEGDMPFTLFLQQSNDTVTGSVSAPQGSTDITSATFKSHMLNIQIDTDSGSYTVTGKLKRGKLSGTWSHNDEKGTWEGTKQAATQ